MRAARRAAWIVAVLATMLMLGACSKTLEMDEVESQITTGIEEQTGATVAEIECPEEVEAKEGDTFECSVRGEDGSEATVEVTQTSDDGAITWILK